MHLCTVLERVYLSLLNAEERFRVEAIRPSNIIFVLAILSSAILAAALPRVDDWATESTRIAASVASGRGFSSPFPQPTGPSAWLPPVYPYLLAGIFRVFGVFTAASYWVAVAVNIIVHSFTCVVLYWVAGETFGHRRGLYAAMALASFPLLFYPLVLLHVLGGVDAGVGTFHLAEHISGTRIFRNWRSCF